MTGGAWWPGIIIGASGVMIIPGPETPTGAPSLAGLKQHEPQGSQQGSQQVSMHGVTQRRKGR